MSGLTFRLKAPLTERLDVTALSPKNLASLSTLDVARLSVGHSKHKLTAGDAFDISGSAGDRVTIVPDGATLDFVAAEMTEGTLIIDGNVGSYAGRKMSGGTLDVRGNAGNFLASCMTGGEVKVSGSAGDSLGGILAGDRFGMAGGMVVVGGDIGARAGDKMRRGTVIVKGKTGRGTGTRMVGGTIWAEGGLGADPGYMMRRGTLIAPTAERLLPTFVDCGRHDLLIVRILAKYLKDRLGADAPKPLGHFVRKIGGDMAVIGRGEILMPAA